MGTTEKNCWDCLYELAVNRVAMRVSAFVLIGINSKGRVLVDVALYVILVMISL
jgi:hypothetical protein